MSKSKKSRKQDETSEDDSEESSTSEQSSSETSSDESVDRKKRKHKRKSKKSRKHKSHKRKDSDSEEDDESSTTDEEELVKRKKHKKHKKKHKRQKNENGSDSDVKIQETEKVLYISSGDEDKNKHMKRDKRLEELKKLRGHHDSGGGDGSKSGTSKWDSPADEKDSDRKRFVNCFVSILKENKRFAEFFFRSSGHRGGDYDSGKDKYDDSRSKDDRYARVNSGGRTDDRRRDDRRDNFKRRSVDEVLPRHEDGYVNRRPPANEFHQRQSAEDFRPNRGTYEDRRQTGTAGGDNYEYRNNDFERPPIPATGNDRDHHYGGHQPHYHRGGRQNFHNRPYHHDRQNNFGQRHDYNHGGNYNRRGRGGHFGGGGDNYVHDNYGRNGNNDAANKRNPFARRFSDQSIDGPRNETIDPDVPVVERTWRDNNRNDRGDRNNGRQFNQNRRDNNGQGRRFHDNGRRFDNDRRGGGGFVNDRIGRDRDRDRNDGSRNRLQKNYRDNSRRRSEEQQPRPSFGKGRDRDEHTKSAEKTFAARSPRSDRSDNRARTRDRKR